MASYVGKNYEEPKDALVESAQEASSDNNSYQDNYQVQEDNLFADDTTDEEEDKDKNNAVEDTAAQETPAADTEQARAEQANNGQSYVDTAVANTTGEQQQYDPVTTMQKAGLDNDTISALQQIDKYAHNQSPEEFQKNFATLASKNQAVADLYMQYYAQAAQTAQTPEQQTLMNSSTEAPKTGSYVDPKGYYDPSQKYGRLDNGEYVYSNSAKQLQNNLAREGYYKGAIDGYFGEQTQQALDNYLADNGVKVEADKGSETVAESAKDSATDAQLAKKEQDNLKQALNGTTDNPTGNKGFLNPDIVAGWNKFWGIDNGTSETQPSSTVNTTNTGDVNSSSSQPATQTDTADVGEQYSFNWFVNEYKKENPAATDEEARSWAGQQIIGMQNGDISRPRDSYISDDIQRGWNRFIGLEEKPINNNHSISISEQPWNLTVDSMKSDLGRMQEEGNAGVQEGQFAKNDQQYALWHFLHPTGTLDDYYRIYPDRAPSGVASESLSEDSATNADMAREEQMDIRRAERERLEELRREAELNSIINGNNNLPENAPPMQVSNGSRQEQTLGDALSALTFRNGVQIPQALNNASKSSGLLSWLAPEASADEMGSIGDATNPDTIASDDIQSSGTRSMGGRPARIERESGTTPNYFEQEQDTDAARAAMESNYGQRVPTNNETMYLFQYINDMDNLKKQFPNYSDSALMDMMLVNEEMRNGQSSYYKWLANQMY